jgi:LysM repeat protein
MKKYVVREGDTMWKISKRTGVRLPLLMAANPQVRDPNNLQPGMVILIPELDKGGTTQSGKPAQAGKASQSPTATGTAGVPGDEAMVPPYFGFVSPHVVQAGEDWQTLSETYGIPVMQLQQMNASQKQTLQQGDIVYVPSALPAPPSGQPPYYGPGELPPGQAGAGVGPEAGAAPPITPPGYSPVPGPDTVGAGAYAPSYPFGYMAEMGPHTHYPNRLADGYGGYVPAPMWPSFMGSYPAVHVGTPYGYPATIYSFPPGYPSASYVVPPGWLPGPYLPAPYRTSTWYADWDESSSWESNWHPTEWDGGTDPAWRELDGPSGTADDATSRP